MKEIELKVPNLGEAEDTEIIEISVKKGDKLSKNDPIIVLESEKAAMEVPSDYDGIIKDIKVKEGDSVKEGVVFAVIEVEETEESKIPLENTVISPSKEIAGAEDVKKAETKTASIDFSGINAGPAVRKIAREMQIDLGKINGSGKNNLITKDDLRKYIHSNLNDSFANNYPTIEALEGFGEYEIHEQSKVRKLGARNLHNSWISIPHVSHIEEVNITKLEEERAKINLKSDIKITPLSYLIQKLASSLEEYPIFNSSLIDEGKLMIKNYINIGIAVDTDNGLVVPVLKAANTLKLEEIAKSVIELSAKAKNKKLMKKDLEGATFSISSLGNIGGLAFTPIINPPEVAILGVSRSKKQLYLNEEGKLKEHIILPITLSYDHRVINGADAGRFMTHLKSILEKDS